MRNRFAFAGVRSILVLNSSLIVFAVLSGCAGGKTSSVPAEPAVMETHLELNEVGNLESPDLFEATVKPMLASNCAPCHVPGGKMYERLPFDNPNVVHSKSESILRRLKSSEDQQTLRDWLDSPSGESSMKPPDGR